MIPLSFLGLALVSSAPLDPCVREPLASAEPRAFLGYDLAHGVTVGRGSPAPWSFSARLYPTLVLDRGVRLAALAGAALVNPDLEAVIGGRLTTRVMTLSPIGNLGVHLGAEGFHGTSSRWAAGPVALVDIGGLVTLGLRANVDFTNDATSLEVGVSLGRLWTKEAGQAPVVVTPTPGDEAGRQRLAMGRAVGAMIGETREQGPEACGAFVAEVRRFLGNDGASATTIAAFRAALQAGGLGEVDRRLPPVIPQPAPAAEPAIVTAWRAGMRDAII